MICYANAPSTEEAVWTNTLISQTKLFRDL